jgi:hypothetical protein
MRLLSRVTRAIATLVAAAVSATPAVSQTATAPKISNRTYTAGSAAITVSGSVSFTQDVPINTQASITSDGTTWLQYGASGAAEPNALITYGETGEIGVSAGRGKFGVTAGITPGEKPQCTGATEVTATEVSGHYTCPGVTSYDSQTRKMGTVSLEVRFTAKS